MDLYRHDPNYLQTSLSPLCNMSQYVKSSSRIAALQIYEINNVYLLNFKCNSPAWTFCIWTMGQPDYIALGAPRSAIHHICLGDISIYLLLPYSRREKPFLLLPVTSPACKIQGFPASSKEEYYLFAGACCHTSSLLLHFFNVRGGGNLRVATAFGP